MQYLLLATCLYSLGKLALKAEAQQSTITVAVRFFTGQVREVAVRERRACLLLQVRLVRREAFSLVGSEGLASVGDEGAPVKEVPRNKCQIERLPDTV